MDNTQQTADSSPEHRKTDPQDRVPVPQKIAYGMGNVTTMMGKLTIKQFTLPVYNMELGVSSSLIGWVLFLSRFWDAFTDPLMGTISDRTKSRWGRRRPYLLLGSVLTGLTFSLLWFFPQGLSDLQYFMYFAVMAVIFYTALTIYVVPWYALGYELSLDYHERTRVQTYATIFGTFAQMGIPWLYWISQQPIFDNTIQGIRWVGAGAGILIVIFALIPAIFTRERLTKDHQILQKTKKEHIPILKGMKQAFQNKPFVIVASVITLVLMGMSFVNSLCIYINSYYVFDGDRVAGSKFMAMLLTSVQIVGLISVPLMTKLATRYGKKNILLLSLGLACCAYLSSFVLFDPRMPYLQLAIALLQGPGVTAVFMLCHSMIGDICDLDELRNGERREGLFGAIYAWMFKVGGAFAFLVAGYVLVWTGYNPDLKIQSESTIMAIRLTYAIVPFSVYALCMFLVWKFPITEQSAYETRSLLEERRGKL